jgi:hypothetical protein
LLVLECPSVIVLYTAFVAVLSVCRAVYFSGFVFALSAVSGAIGPATPVVGIRLGCVTSRQPAKQGLVVFSGLVVRNPV